MDESWISDYDAAMVAMFEGGEFKPVGYISYAVVREVKQEVLDISWYPNIYDRFHEVSVLLPRSAFATCVDCQEYDVRPVIFVNGDWLSRIHLRPYSAFALIDVIGIKDALAKSRLSNDKLLSIRDRIDKLASATPAIAFISFADSVLLKINWFIGQYNSEISYSYEPENLIKLIQKISSIYREELDMDVYAVISQGVNEYTDDSLIHISDSKNHISLNSLGLPFAEILAIDSSVRIAIHNKFHPPSDLYMDQKFYFSLKFKIGFDRNKQSKYSYKKPIGFEEGIYYYSSIDSLVSNLDC